MGPPTSYCGKSELPPKGKHCPINWLKGVEMVEIYQRKKLGWRMVHATSNRPEEEEAEGPTEPRLFSQSPRAQGQHPSDPDSEQVP